MTTEERSANVLYSKIFIIHHRKYMYIHQISCSWLCNFFGATVNQSGQFS